jgi:drug/metabolite transporter (DMT)-like permease
MIMSAFTIILLRALRNVHFTLSNFSFGFLGTIESLIMCWTLSTFSFPQSTNDWILAGTIGILFFFGQMCFTLALQLEDAGPVSLARSCDVIFAYIWQFVFLNVVPDVYRYATKFGYFS